MVPQSLWRPPGLFLGSLTLGCHLVDHEAADDENAQPKPTLVLGKFEFTGRCKHNQKCRKKCAAAQYKPRAGTSRFDGNN